MQLLCAHTTLNAYVLGWSVDSLYKLVLGNSAEKMLLVLFLCINVDNALDWPNPVIPTEQQSMSAPGHLVHRCYLSAEGPEVTSAYK